MSLQSLRLICTKSQTKPKRPGKPPRDVYIVTGQVQGFDALFRDLGGHLYRGHWSFWTDPTDEILARSNERMSIAEQIAYKSERKLAKAERYERYAENAQARSEQAYTGAKSIMDRIPLGQPILIGHHSERAARADQRRIERKMTRSVEESRKASYFTEQSESLKMDATSPKSRRYIGNRIEEKAAEIAKIKRYLNGQYTPDSEPGSMPVSNEYRVRLQGRLKDTEEVLAQWQGELAKFGDRTPSRETLQIGMFVKTWGGWREVIKINPKSVTIRDYFGNPNRPPDEDSYTRTIKYHKISEFKSRETV